MDDLRNKLNDIKVGCTIGATLINHLMYAESSYVCRIFCTQYEDGREVKRFVDSPDDLFKLGWSEEKVVGLGLY